MDDYIIRILFYSIFHQIVWYNRFFHSNWCFFISMYFVFFYSEKISVVFYDSFLYDDLLFSSSIFPFLFAQVFFRLKQQHLIDTILVLWFDCLLMYAAFVKAINLWLATRSIILFVVHSLIRCNMLRIRFQFFCCKQKES